jgi:hypothetical protein
MKPEEFDRRLREIGLRRGSVSDKIRTLLLERNLLEQPMMSETIRERLYERAGLTVKINNLTSHMKPFLKTGVVLRRKAKGESEDRVIWYAAWQDEGYQSTLETYPFSAGFEKSLGKDFETEFADLRLVYGRSGTCSAFMFRKLLEKTTFIALVKNGTKGNKLKDPSGRYLGLDSLLVLVTKVKHKSMPILSPKVYEKIQGVKFLGDSAAHNYLINITMEDMIPQLPYVTLALKEIAKGLA